MILDRSLCSKQAPYLQTSQHYTSTEIAMIQSVIELTRNKTRWEDIAQAFIGYGSQLQLGN